MNTRQKNKELQTSARVLHLENIMFSTPKTLFLKKLNTSDNSSGRHIGNYASAPLPHKGRETRATIIAQYEKKKREKNLKGARKECCSHFTRTECLTPHTHTHISSSNFLIQPLFYSCVGFLRRITPLCRKNDGYHPANGDLMIIRARKPLKLDFSPLQRINSELSLSNHVSFIISKAIRVTWSPRPYHYSTLRWYAWSGG